MTSVLWYSNRIRSSLKKLCYFGASIQIKTIKSNHFFMQYFKSNWISLLTQSNQNRRRRLKIFFLFQHLQTQTQTHTIHNTQTINNYIIKFLCDKPITNFIICKIPIIIRICSFLKRFWKPNTNVLIPRSRNFMILKT